MALIPHTQAKIGGVVLDPTAATAGPDTVKPGDNVIVLVHNRSAGAVTATTTVPGNTKWGQPEPDVQSVSIPASGLGVVGPLPVQLADSGDNLVDITLSASASVDLFAIRV